MPTRLALRPLTASSFARAPVASLLLATLAVAGCASSGVGSGSSSGPVGRMLESVGLARRSGSEQAPGEIPISLYAASNLNAGNDGRPLAVVVRVYRLRQIHRFEQAPFTAFLDEASERAAFGDDLIGVSEIVLQPGQRHEITERLPAEATAVGVVALFRAPAQNRWRLVFDARSSVRDGVTVGLHACAMTTTSNALLTRLTEEPHRLATARCEGG